MNVLCVTPYYKPAYIYGGPARSVPSLCEAMASDGARITVFTTNANGRGRALDTPTGKAVDLEGTTVYYFPLAQLGARIMPFYAPALGRACHDCIAQYDVVYVLGNWTYPVRAAATSAAAECTPYILSPRGSLMDWSMGHKALKKHLYLALFERPVINRAAVIHATTALERRQIEGWHFVPPVVTIPNGLDASEFANIPARGRLRESMEVSATGTLSLFVGRLHQEKRVDLIIDAFARLSHQFSDAHLLLVGSDCDGSGIRAQEQVRRLRLTGRVHFTGHLVGRDLMQAYVDADVLTLLSHRENFGMVAVEAMATGLPVLLAHGVGLAEEVEQAGAGLVVGAEVDQVAAAWGSLLANQLLRREMGARGRKLVQEKFMASKVADRMLGLFTSVCERSEDGRALASPSIRMGYS